ncbi:MAG: hypothetical protein QM656_00870 [Paracoccaceae bacterium]
MRNLRLRGSLRWIVLALLAGTQPAAADRTAPVLGGVVAVGLPDGYCIDRSASREGRDAAVVLMGRCSSVSAPDPAIISVSVGTAGSASVLRGGGKALAAFFTSEKGRGMLARSGRPGDVKILRASDSSEGFYLYLSDRRVGDYWRAVTGVKGRLVTVSATAAPGQRLAPEAGRGLVQQVVRSVRKANPPQG